MTTGPGITIQGGMLLTPGYFIGGSAPPPPLPFFNTPAAMPNPPAAYMYSVAVNSSGLFVAVGYDANDYPLYAISNDGYSWSTPAHMNGSTTPADMFAVTVNSSGLFVAVGGHPNSGAVYATSTDGVTWTTPAFMNGSTTDAGMKAITWLPSSTANPSGLFVAVGTNNSSQPLYATSVDGTTWTTPALMNGSTVSSPLTSVAVNSAGLFVAIGFKFASPTDYGPVYSTSTDGTTWTTPAYIAGNLNPALLSAITVNSSDLFVAVGGTLSTPDKPVRSTGALYATSTDGSTWSTPAQMPGSEITYVMDAITLSPSGTFVAVGTDLAGTREPIYSTSTDGSTWTNVALIGGYTGKTQITSVAINVSGDIVAVGSLINSQNEGYVPLYAISYAGSSSWSAPQPMGFPILKSIVVNSSDTFVAVGYNESSYQPLYATSPDGSNWTGPVLLGNPYGNTAAQMNSVTVNSSGLFVAVGTDYSNQFGILPTYSTSSDGMTWTPQSTMGGTSSPGYMQSVTVNSSGLFVAIGYDGGTVPLYATSSDGMTWTAPAAMGGTSSYCYMQAVTWSPPTTANPSGLFVAVGSDGNGTTYPLYATSTDGSTWTVPAVMNGSTSYAFMLSVAVNSAGLFVAVGYDYNDAAVYATSADGSTWTTPAHMNGSTAFAHMTSVTVDSAGVFVAVGINNSNRPLYAYSTDGSTWTTPALMNGSTDYAQMSAVTVDTANLFVAVGAGPNGYPVYATTT